MTIVKLLSPQTIESIGSLKKNLSGDSNISLNLDEVLIALRISATSNLETKTALEKISELKGCEVHLTHIPKPGDENVWRKIGVNLTCDPVFSSANLFES